MCDYSLTARRSRSATIGERLIVYRFDNGVRGFISDIESRALAEARPALSRRVIDWFRPSDLCAVCVAPGAHLILRSLPGPLRLEVQAGCEVEVVFSRSGSSDVYRDGVVFPPDRMVLLQELPVGLVADVLTLGGTDVKRPVERQLQALVNDID